MCKERRGRRGGGTVDLDTYESERGPGGEGPGSMSSD